MTYPPIDSVVMQLTTRPMVPQQQAFRFIALWHRLPKIAHMTAPKSRVTDKRHQTVSTTNQPSMQTRKINNTRINVRAGIGV